MIVLPNLNRYLDVFRILSLLFTFHIIDTCFCAWVYDLYGSTNAIALRDISAVLQYLRHNHTDTDLEVQ
jgi:hypothetical protein